MPEPQIPFGRTSPMVAITAGVVFVGGGAWALLALGLIAATSPFGLEDFVVSLRGLGRRLDYHREHVQAQ